jgi:hypothetical protein
MGKTNADLLLLLEEVLNDRLTKGEINTTTCVLLKRLRDRVRIPGFGIAG